ncbi:hypothetical protein [Massilia antarctica]|uniref:hypothetical protein n=1 Tax=Massilia antarctica TaxID=2765360 RepID=UPI00226DBF82|nr:hypothetical protein [Massilia sp. H27-R4]MCY0915449.1 hypothetical protein [Massilia sp. H27-R4]
MHDFAAKIVCDNLQSLATETALREAPLPPRGASTAPRPLHLETTVASTIARRRHRHASARRTTLDRRPDLLAPAWHYQIQTTGCTSEIAQIHESEAVLMRCAAKFGGLGAQGAGIFRSLVFTQVLFSDLTTNPQLPVQF